MKKIMTVLLIAAFVCIGFGTAYADDYGSYVTKIFTKQGGDSLFAKSGGQISILSGGVLDFLSGSYLKIGGTTVTSSADKLNGIMTATAIVADTVALSATDAYGKIFYALPLAGKAKRTLPSAAAGLNIEFMVADADSLLISAATGDSLITSAGAAWKTTSSVAGTVRLVAIDATRWIMQYTLGTWTSY